MPIYALASAGRAILAFSARDHVDALAFALNGFIRAELANLKSPEGGPLWDGQVELTVRQATAREQAISEADLPCGIRDQVIESWARAFTNGHFVFLVDYLEPDE